MDSIGASFARIRQFTFAFTREPSNFCSSESCVRLALQLLRCFEAILHAQLW